MIESSSLTKESRQIMIESAKKVYETEWGRHKLTVEYGEMAKQANGAVLVRYGETVVLSTATASDPNASPQMAAMLGSSLALGVSDIPFDGPIAGVTVGLIDGEFIINPSTDESRGKRSV